MKIFIVYDQGDTDDADTKETQAAYGKERRATDVIDGDTQDAIVIWRSIIGDSGQEAEVVRMASTGVYENISFEEATAIVRQVERGI